MIEIDEKKFIQCLNHIAATPEGKAVLACLKEYCRYDNDLVVEGKPEDTYANATLRRAYLYFRKRIDIKHLIEIEFNYRRKPEDGKPAIRKSDRTKSDVQRTR